MTSGLRKKRRAFRKLKKGEGCLSQGCGHSHRQKELKVDWLVNEKVAAPALWWAVLDYSSSYSYAAKQRRQT